MKLKENIYRHEPGVEFWNELSVHEIRVVDNSRGNTTISFYFNL